MVPWMRVGGRKGGGRRREQGWIRTDIWRVVRRHTILCATSQGGGKKGGGRRRVRDTDRHMACM